MPTFRRRQSYDLNPPDEVHNVIYLGNVLTIMGKGDASVDKPLNVIWRTFNSTKHRREISMKLSVTRSGLKAETKQLGLTEYWAHRVTYCVAPPQYPRVFCWVYKHEGKRMKPELRCHAVLCKKATEPAQICANLNNFLHAALLEYKREKLAIEKARKNSLSGGMGPRRKILLQTGSLNFRPPVNRSKSAPRLGSIDEEDEEDELLEGESCDVIYEQDIEEYSDVESLCYRNTPVLGGSATDDDSCSVASSSAQSTSSSSGCSVPSSSSHNSKDSQKSTNSGKFEASNQNGIHDEIDNGRYESNSPNSPVRKFKRQLSMTRESQAVNQARLCRQRDELRRKESQSTTITSQNVNTVHSDEKDLDLSLPDLDSPSASQEECPGLTPKSEDMTSSTLPIGHDVESSSNSNHDQFEQVTSNPDPSPKTMEESQPSVVTKRRLFKSGAISKFHVKSSIGSDASDTSQLSDESGYVEEFPVKPKLQAKKCGDVLIVEQSPVALDDCIINGAKIVEASDV
ncbi:phosphotyrosine interaction domain (PTB/PID) domain-containing protein [Ditylenchus destructor]|uniref:Phosphotyrosine interaction domain (PTB/PID) domain-containing protein n=1 Tax=Ditylenchus destructor TaxID=166010 RepID=A0AAD4R239_9BILA|nr:phosphotyrosine interaction domain (PTB/PID) domain-containing protein [Ditylenchus destructor]